MTPNVISNMPVRVPASEEILPNPLVSLEQTVEQNSRVFEADSNTAVGALGSTSNVNVDSNTEASAANSGTQDAVVTSAGEAEVSSATE